MNMNRVFSFALFTVLAAFALMGCKPYAVAQPDLLPDDAVGPAEGDGAPISTTDARVVDLRKTAEQRLFPAMKPALVEFIRNQEFFAEVTPVEYTMLETFRDTGKTAEKFGTETVFMDTLRLATEQTWYTDGFDDNEAKHMTALFRAYQSSLTIRKLGKFDQIGSQMASSIRGNYFYVTNLPEHGEVTVIVTADPKYESMARNTLMMAVDNLPKVEAIVGEFPFDFVHIRITDLEDGVGGTELKEFVILSPKYITTEVVSHELTHATLHGVFPVWFEEGLAYFVGRTMEGSSERYEAEYVALLNSVRLPRKLDLSLKFDHSSFGYSSALIQGFLFFKGLNDLIGPDQLGVLLRALRGKTFANENELFRAIVTNSQPDKQQAVQAYLCGAVLGLRSGCG